MTLSVSHLQSTLTLLLMDEPTEPIDCSSIPLIRGFDFDIEMELQNPKIRKIKKLIERKMENTMDEWRIQVIWRKRRKNWNLEEEGREKKEEEEEGHDGEER